MPLDPGEISITRNDAGDFVLNNLEKSVALENEEDTTAGVPFVPQSEGEKHANLSIKEDTVNLRGNAFDATISVLPWAEVSVSFQPTTVGAKKAKLVIGSKEVALSGDVFMTNTSVTENTGKQDSKFEMYPNPASENVIIETDRNATITLWDITGKMILKEKSSGKIEWIVSDLKNGIYLIQSDTEHHSNIKKLIVP